MGAVHRILIALSLCLPWASSLGALDPALELEGYDIRRWTTGSGLPLNAVTAISGTRDGYLWIGTQEGLARFDGLSFTVFRRREIPLLGDSFISALLEDRDGRLWIGTRQGLVGYQGGTFTRYTEADGLPHDYVRTLLVDHRGDLWIGTYGGGIARRQDGRIQAFGAEAGLHSGIARALHEDVGGVLWVGTADGLFFRDGERFVVAGREVGLQGASIRAIAEDAAGILWVATDDGRLLEARGGRFRDRQVLGAGQGVWPLAALYRDRHDTLWVGTEGGGLARVVGGVATWLTRDQGLAHDAVGSFYEDGNGGLWVGTRGGLNLLTTPRILSLSQDDGLAGNFARAILEDRKGNLWIGSEDGGVSLVRGDTVAPSPLPSILAEEHVRSLFEDRSGDLWVGTRAGILRATGDGQERFTTEEGLPSNTVNAIQEGAPGSGILWVGTAGGLARLRGGVVEKFPLEAARGEAGDRGHAADERRGDLVRCLHSDPQGALWVCTEHGIVRTIQGEGPRRFTVEDGLSSDFVYAVHQDADGILWIGTAGGLARFDGDSFHSFSTDHGLFSDLIFRVLEDERNNLWLSCSRGVFRVSKTELEAVRRGAARTVTSTWFDESDGLASSECNGGTQPAGWKARDGRLWFPTQRGVVAIDPEAMASSAIPPSVVVEGLEVDGAALPPVAQEKGFVVSPGSQVVEILFTAPVFSSPEKVRFRYRLEGYERRWTTAVKRRSAVYTRLPHGAYQFHVSSSYLDGSWGPDASVAVEVEPWFYETSWFLALFAMLVLVAVTALYRLRRRQLDLRERRLSRKVEERTNQLETANRALEQLAAVDPLTGIANQRQFRQILDKEWRRMARGKRSLGLLLIDVDYFKPYNDTYGHLAGDACLIQVSDVLSRTLARRAGDVVARYGGEEFAAVLPGADLEATRVLGESLRQAVEDLHIEHLGSTVSPWVTVSVGAAAVQPRREALIGAVDQLMGDADGALYASKRAGRNRVT